MTNWSTRHRVFLPLPEIPYAFPHLLGKLTCRAIASLTRTLTPFSLSLDTNSFLFVLCFFPAARAPALHVYCVCKFFLLVRLWTTWGKSLCFVIFLFLGSNKYLLNWTWDSKYQIYEIQLERRKAELTFINHSLCARPGTVLGNRHYSIWTLQ